METFGTHSREYEFTNCHFVPVTTSSSQMCEKLSKFLDFKSNHTLELKIKTLGIKPDLW